MDYLSYDAKAKFKNKGGKGLSCILLSLFLFFSSAVVCGADVFEIAEKYNNQKKYVVKLEAKKRQVLAELYGIDKETKKLVIKKTELDNEKVQLDYKLSRISTKIVKIEGELKELTPELIERVSFLEKIQDLPWFYAFLTSQNVSDLDYLYKTATNLNQQQTDQMTEFVQLHEKLNKEKENLIKVAENIIQVKKNLASQEKKIEQNQASKSRFLKKLNINLSSEKKSLGLLKLLGRKVVKDSEFKDLGLLFGSNFFDKKGRLSHPIRGRIVHNFGLIKGLSYDQVELMHKGFFYKASDDERVYPVSSGRVRHAGRVAGYGAVVIVDHGGRYYTVYANLKEHSVKKGDVVKPNQKIGVIGYKHLIFDKGLYFEVRHFSEPQNPKDWLKKKKNKLATI